MSTGAGGGGGDTGGATARNGGGRGRWRDGVVEAALRCYPAWWRDRYGDEIRQVVADLAAEGRSAPVLALDLVRGAVRARVAAAGMPRMPEVWAARTRSSVAAATLPWLLVLPLIMFVTGRLTLVMPKGMVPAAVPTSPFSFGVQPETIAHGQIVATPPLSAAGAVALDSARASALLVLISLLVLACGWGGLRGAIRRSSAPHRRQLLLLAWAPALSLLVDVALIVTQNLFRPSSYRSLGGGPVQALNGNPAVVHALQPVLNAVSVGGWLVAIFCVGVAATHARIDLADLRFGRNIALAVSVLHCALLGSYLTWVAALYVQDHQTAPGVTVLAAGHQAALLPVATVLACTAAVSALSSSIARRSWRTLSLLA